MWCYFLKPIDMIKKLYCAVILISSKEPELSFVDKVEYWIKSIIATGLISIVLARIGLWYSSNSEFVNWVFICIVLNAVIGGILHKKEGTFSWTELIKSTIIMLAYLVAVYLLLEALRSPLGDNDIGSEIKKIVQIATLIWPVSKSLKSIHILTDKKHPPHFIMKRLYNFEKTGDEKALLGKIEDEDNDKLDNVG